MSQNSCYRWRDTALPKKHYQEPTLRFRITIHQKTDITLIFNTLNVYHKINCKIDVPVKSGAVQVDFVKRLQNYFREISSQRTIANENDNRKFLPQIRERLVN